MRSSWWIRGYKQAFQFSKHPLIVQNTPQPASPSAAAAVLLPGPSGAGWRPDPHADRLCLVQRMA